MNYIFRDMFLIDIGLTIINSIFEKDNLYAKVPNTFLILIKHREAWLQFSLIYFLTSISHSCEMSGLLYLEKEVHTTLEWKTVFVCKETLTVRGMQTINDIKEYIHLFSICKILGAKLALILEYIIYFWNSQITFYPNTLRTKEWHYHRSRPGHRLQFYCPLCLSYRV